MMPKGTSSATPRTDASSHHTHHARAEFTVAECSRQLERELTEAKAEIERLKKILKRIAVAASKSVQA